MRSQNKMGFCPSNTGLMGGWGSGHRWFAIHCFLGPFVGGAPIHSILPVLSSLVGLMPLLSHAFSSRFRVLFYFKSFPQSGFVSFVPSISLFFFGCFLFFLLLSLFGFSFLVFFFFLFHIAFFMLLWCIYSYLFGVFFLSMSPVFFSSFIAFFFFFLVIFGVSHSRIYISRGGPRIHFVVRP